MYRKLVFTLCLALLSSAVLAEEKGAAANTPAASTASTPSIPAAGAPTAPAAPESADPDAAKQLKGMSVLGNNEAPMSLFIVPWKSSELGVETNLSRTLDERDMPVDRDVFMREVEFYGVSVGGKTAAQTAVASQIVK